jgi:hypothetical protein
MSTKAVTRYVGFCAICETDHKLAPQAWRCKGDEAPALSLVHHGYLRPGTGEIQGDCFAVGALPYELSKDVCEDWRDRMELKLEAATNTLTRLRHPDLSELSGTTELIFAGPLTEEAARKASPMFGHRCVNPYERLTWLTVRRDSKDFFERDLFSSWRDQGIRECESTIRFATYEIERMGKFIAGWLLKPVRTEEEQVERDRAKKAAARAERDAEKQAARDAKAVKKRILDEKKERWEKERRDLLQMYRDLFVDLAKQPKHAGTRAAALELWRAMNKARYKKGYLHFYPSDLAIDAALIDLGLARLSPRGNEKPWVNYAYDSGVLP